MYAACVRWSELVVKDGLNHVWSLNVLPCDLSPRRVVPGLIQDLSCSCPSQSVSRAGVLRDPGRSCKGTYNLASKGTNHH